MKKIAIFFMLLIMCWLACNKEVSRSVKKEDAPHVDVAVGKIDDSGNPAGNDNDSTGNGNNGGGEEIYRSEQNEHSIYTFMGVSGVYFGCSSSFRTEKETLEFIFGTSKTTNLSFNQEEFEQLIHTGERHFGSLGAFTSFPQLDSNKVEIAYTDKNGRRWCSTRITEKKTTDGVEAAVKIEGGGEFYLEEAHKIEIAAETEGYRLKGRFECMLYEVNGSAKRKLQGEFTGIVAPK
jgi:hypothetical protein